MKFLKAGALFLAMGGVAACNGGEGTSDTQTAESVETAIVDQPMQPGLYAVGDGTQEYARTRLSDDGTYTDMTVDGQVVGGGTWSTEGQEICFDPDGDGEDQQERCWVNGDVQENGSFITTRTDGSESYTVTPLDE